MKVTTEEVISALEEGSVTVRGEFWWGSNYTFLAQVEHAGRTLPTVYKPIRGERPLWDFPAASLARREVAAFLVSEALGWGMVPPTVFRSDGPLGPGSIQLYIDHDTDYHYFNFSEEDRQRLRPVALFDLLINNADRKGSHVLLGLDGRLWLIDHGISFHVEGKLRTVIWDFVGEPIPEEYCADLSRLLQMLEPLNGGQSKLAKDLEAYLSRAEVSSMALRAEVLVVGGHFPPPDPHRRAFPWPQL